MHSYASGRLKRHQKAPISSLNQKGETPRERTLSRLIFDSVTIYSLFFYIRSE